VKPIPHCASLYAGYDCGLNEQYQDVDARDKRGHDGKLRSL
jgi:hypothetical protein